ncbi:MAG: MalY/PatB family protein [Candidatus Promineifilaceae bacterium]
MSLQKTRTIMKFNFDEEITRGGTSCIKWEFIDEGDTLRFHDQSDPKYGRDRLLPMWVADMDFRCPPAVIEAVVDRAQQGVYGYSSPCDSYFEAVINWMDQHHGWSVQRDWITLSPGVVPAIYMMVQAFVKPGDKVLVQRPVYYPFFDAIKNNGAEIVSNSLRYDDGQYEMDFVDLAQKAADPDLKMAILCSPHNPVGRVWSREELVRFGEICIDNGVLVVADEIHCDLIYGDSSFTSFTNICDDFAQNSLVCTAASKTFNLAGLKTSNIITPNQELRERFEDVLLRNGIYGANPFGLVAVEAAYRFGKQWLDEVMNYIEDNYRFMESYIADHIPQLKIVKPQGTYLVWVDFREVGFDAESRKSLLMEKAKVYLDEGELFGPEGAGFERFNIACPRSILEEALERISAVVK